jgi:hypothetical protein
VLEWEANALVVGTMQQGHYLPGEDGQPLGGEARAQLLTAALGLAAAGWPGVIEVYRLPNPLTDVASAAAFQYAVRAVTLEPAALIRG